MSPQSHASTPSRVPLPLHDSARLHVDADFANLVVVAAAEHEEPFIELGDGPSFPVEVKVHDGVTRVHIGGPGGDDSWWQERWWDVSFWDHHPWRKRGMARVVLHVPPSICARIHSSAGKTQVSGLHGCELDVAADAGVLTLQDVSGKLTLSTQAGRIDGQGLRGALDVTTNAGAVRLEVLALDAGTHRVRTNMGAIRIELADGMPVRIDARTTMGSSRVDVPSSRDAAIVLDVEADLGAIKIKPSQHRWTPKDAASAGASPYRKPASTADQAEVDELLRRVAAKELSPEEARERLRAMGWA